MIRAMKLPPKVKGFAVCTAEPDGEYYDIVVNEDLSDYGKLEVLEHEQRHIDRDHFHKGDLLSVAEMEEEADTTR